LNHTQKVIEANIKQYFDLDAVKFGRVSKMVGLDHPHLCSLFGQLAQECCLPQQVAKRFHQFFN